MSHQQGRRAKHRPAIPARALTSVTDSTGIPPKTCELFARQRSDSPPNPESGRLWLKTSQDFGGGWAGEEERAFFALLRNPFHLAVTAQLVSAGDNGFSTRRLLIAEATRRPKIVVMKRDMALIRLQLMEVEGEDPKPDLSAYTEEQQVFHMALLIEAGLVDGSIIQDSDGFPATTLARRLTWSGHEFLDAARNDTTWNKATEKIKSQGISIGFDLLKTVLIETAKGQLKAHGLIA